MQLKDRHIIILGLMRYDADIASTNYTIARHLAKDNHVYYIDNPYTWKDCLRNRDRDALQRRKKHFGLNDNFIIDTDVERLKVVITPPVISINWLPEGRLYRSLLKLNERIVRYRIKQVIRKFNITDYVFINSFNFYYPGVASSLKADLNVYHCVDPLAFSYEQKHGLVSEKKIVEEADLILCTSRQLRDEKAKANPNSFFIPNAADLTHSSKALNIDLPVHELLKNIPRPIVGYFGNIERRINYELIRDVANANPDKSFVFTGPKAPEHIPDWFYQLPNVYLTGAVPYDAMPSVIKGYDVAMIPFKKDHISANIFPLKLFEYLGAGKPVVSTDFNPDLEKYSGSAVSYCSDATLFSQAIAASLLLDNEEMKNERLAIAAQNTWEIRAGEYADLLGRYLHQKTGTSVNQKRQTLQNQPA
jgi:glycosyltransferase involved in cell wall biosynthesis